MPTVYIDLSAKQIEAHLLRCVTSGAVFLVGSRTRLFVLSSTFH